MLRMYNLPGGKLCQEYGRQFVNNRLIELMENVMAEYAQTGNNTYMEKIKSSKDWEKPLETIIDLNRMRQDEKFVTEWLEEYGLIPQTIGPRRALHDFFSLYDLLKAKEEYKPDLSMEYILLSIIDMELDFCKDMPELYHMVKRIPRSIRTKVMQELLIEAAECKDQDPETEETVQQIAKDMMASFEDLNEYINICFEDTDCLFLNDMDEEEMERFGIENHLGFHIMGDTRKIKITHTSGESIEADISPWKQNRQ